MKRTLAIILTVMTVIAMLAVSASAATANTWKDPRLDNERFDGSGTAAIAYRFATQGSGKLIAINPYLAGESGKFDLIVYKWDKNYNKTVSGTPVLEMKEIVFNKEDAKWTSFSEQAITLTTPLPADEYLFVMTNFKDTSWAICNYLFSANPGFKVYKNGAATEEDRSLFWQLVFEDGGWYKDTPLSADIEDGGDNPGGDNPGGDNPGGDNPGGDNPGGDNPGTSDAVIAASAVILLAGAVIVYDRKRRH